MLVHLPTYADYMADKTHPSGLPERLSGAQACIPCSHELDPAIPCRRLEAYSCPCMHAGSSPSWDPAAWTWDSVRMVATPVASPVAKPCCAMDGATSDQRQPVRRAARPPRAAAPQSRKPVRDNVCQADGCHKALANLTFYHQRNRCFADCTAAGCRGPGPHALGDWSCTQPLLWCSVGCRGTRALKRTLPTNLACLIALPDTFPYFFSLALTWPCSRICEEHIKASNFRKEGELLRFCQRCGVSHPLAEFDGQRKSCRKQLEKHNARRWVG